MKTQAHKTRRFAGRSDIPKTYRELCQLHLPRPIHDEVENVEAVTMMNALAVFMRLNAEQQDYLDVVTELVDAYDKSKLETVQWPRACYALFWDNDRLGDGLGANRGDEHGTKGLPE